MTPEGKPRRAGVAMCVAIANTPESNITDTTYALVHTLTGTTLQDINGRGLRKLVYDEVEAVSERTPSCNYTPTDGYEAGGYFVVLKSVFTSGTLNETAIMLVDEQRIVSKWTS